MLGGASAGPALALHRRAELLAVVAAVKCAPFRQLVETPLVSFWKLFRFYAFRFIEELKILFEKVTLECSLFGYREEKIIFIHIRKPLG